MTEEELMLLWEELNAVVSDYSSIEQELDFAYMHHPMSEVLTWLRQKMSDCGEHGAVQVIDKLMPEVKAREVGHAEVSKECGCGDAVSKDGEEVKQFSCESDCDCSQAEEKKVE